ncbi:MAG: hypothetical protein ACYS0D_08820 [Planctomycetota bacterium]|jgi:hypothetical protein
MLDFTTAVLVTTGVLLAGAGFLHLLPKLGPRGRAASEAMCAAPLLDVVVTFFTIAPLIAGPLLGGWAGLAGAAVGQAATLLLWTLLHEMTHPRQRCGPRIVGTLNEITGRWRNLTAVSLTGLVVPLFWFVRLAQILIYPALTLLVGLPRYHDRDWINVSRHKFDGLIGHDLVWCLYCDWMTGVWALGSEMLRNVESFWCPIRFASDKKCENCRIDFPDVEKDWVPADGTMADVEALLRKKHGGRRERSWYGHPARLTVEGETIAR